MDRIAILSREEVERIHGVSLRLLERIGVGVPHDGVLDILAEGEADVDREKRIARLPSRLVEPAHRRIVTSSDKDLRRIYCASWYQRFGSMTISGS